MGTENQDSGSVVWASKMGGILLMVMIKLSAELTHTADASYFRGRGILSKVETMQTLRQISGQGFIIQV